MRVNEKLAIVTNKVLLVPYEAHHVLKYHGWMQSPEIQEATASEPMTLEEEYDNQQSWRTSHDKLTFIVCEPLPRTDSSNSIGTITAKLEDSNDKTRGDINFFLYPDDEEQESEPGRSDQPRRFRGEVDVMIAETQHRGQGLGEGAVRSLLIYLRKHSSEILGEYLKGEGVPGGTAQLVGLMAKIKEGNVSSRALFKKLGFRQEGEVNYFGEVKMVKDWEEVEKSDGLETGLEYRELSYE